MQSRAIPGLYENPKTIMLLGDAAYDLTDALKAQN